MKRSATVLAGILIILGILMVWLLTAGLVQVPRLPWARPSAPEPVPTATVWPYAFTWQRDNPLAGRCDALRVDQQGRVLYGSCHETLAAGQLTPIERQSLDAMRSQYADENALYQINPGGLDSETIRLQFSGRGAQVMDAFGRTAVSDWAAQVHARLMLEAQEASLVALARGHLAGRLDLAPSAITVISSEPVTWPDRCLGLGGEASCPQIPTAGMRIMLGAGGNEFEYRTDLLGTVLPLDQATTPGVTPTSAIDLPTTTPTVRPSITPETTTAPATPSATTRPSPTPTLAPTYTPVSIATPPTRNGDMWEGAYFGNRDLIEPPALRRQDEQISFNWGNLSPAPSLPQDRFSVRWSRQVDFRRGYYQFDIQCDDGLRLWVDDVLVMDHWYDGYTEHSAEAYLGGGRAPVVLEYYENEGLSEIGMTWRLTQPGPERTATPTVEPYYEGWRGAYYNNTLFLGEAILVRDDQDIEFDWEDGAPDDAIPEDRFSVRWTRRLHFDEGAYRFITTVDDGVRLWIDDRPCIDDWETGSLRDVNGYRWLSGGTHDVRLDYFEESGDAEVHLDWSRLEAFPDWRASYYANRYLEGDPVIVRNEDEIDDDWDEDAPLVGLPEDEFSIRWTQPVWFATGRYRFQATVDDGIRLYLDDILLIDEWHDSDREEYEQVTDLLAGTYDIRVEYYENGGNAQCSVEWTAE